MKISTELKLCLTTGALLAALTACDSRTNPRNQANPDNKEQPPGTYATPTPHSAGIPAPSPRPVGSPARSPQR